MRPISKRHGFLRHPLDTIMGSEGNVRLLRVFIHETGSPLGASDLARLSEMTPAGTRKSLERLLDAGVVEAIGSGRALQYRLRSPWPLFKALALLFDSEHEQYDSFVSSLKKALAGFTEIRSAWFDDAPMGSGEPVEMCVVADAKAVDWIGEELRARLKDLEQAYDLIIEPRILTRADAPAPGPHAVFLVSMAADNGTRDPQPQLHALKDERSLRIAQKIVEMMRSDPALIARARHYLNQLLQDDQGMATHAIAEWRQILESYSPRQLRQLLVSTSSRATRLRQSSPFFAVLSPEERDRLISALEKGPNDSNPT